MARNIQGCDTPALDKTTVMAYDSKQQGKGNKPAPIKELINMEDYEETLAAAIGEADYYSTNINAIYGYEITGVVTAKTFTTEQIAKYNLPEFMAWNTGTRAEYDASGDTYIGFDSLEDMADYIDSESPLVEDEE